MHLGTIDVVFMPRVVGRIWPERGFSIGETLIFTDKVNDIHTKARGAPLKPKKHHVVDGGTDFGVFPVEVGLLGGKERQEVLVCIGIICPGTIGFPENL